MSGQPARLAQHIEGLQRAGVEPDRDADGGSPRDFVDVVQVGVERVLEGSEHLGRQHFAIANAQHHIDRNELPRERRSGASLPGELEYGRYPNKIGCREHHFDTNSSDGYGKHVRQRRLN